MLLLILGSQALQKVVDAVCGQNNQNLKDLIHLDGNGPKNLTVI